MKKEDKNNIDILHPKFRNQIEDVFKNVNSSISMLYDSATKDVKTGVYNYNFFNNLFNIEMEKAKRGLQKLSLFVLDIDHFKKINDNYGHVQADKLLVNLAQILEKNVRKSDIVARFGGEEFVILLPETEIERAKEVTSRIKKEITEDNIMKKHSLTISGGLTEFIKGDNAEKMIKRADKALYDAKNSGRNRLVAIGLKEKKEEFEFIEGKIKGIKKIKKINKKKILRELKEII